MLDQEIFKCEALPVAEFNGGLNLFEEFRLVLLQELEFVLLCLGDVRTILGNYF